MPPASWKTFCRRLHRTERSIKMAAGYLAGWRVCIFQENTLVATGVVFLSTFAGNSVYYILLNMVGIKVPFMLF